MISFFISAAHASAESQPASMGANAASMLVSLFIVLAIAVGLSWIYKRLMPQNMFTNKGLEIISSRHLGSKERLMLIKVGERYLLLGVTTQSIQSLAEFSKEELPEALLSLPKELKPLWQKKKS